MHSHQAPTLIGCLIVKERYCQILYYLLPARFATPLSLAPRCLQQRNEIMKKFFSLVKSASHTAFRFLACDLFRSASLSSYRNIRVNPKFSATAKPKTITRFLQIVQPAFA
jgi:hypothetical protein